MHILGWNPVYDTVWLVKMGLENQVNEFIMLWKRYIYKCLTGYIDWLIDTTVLMSVLGNDILVGLPQNVRILHIAQLEEFTPGTTILQELLSTDNDRTRIIKEAQGFSFFQQFSNAHVYN